MHLGLCAQKEKDRLPLHCAHVSGTLEYIPRGGGYSNRETDAVEDEDDSLCPAVFLLGQITNDSTTVRPKILRYKHRSVQREQEGLQGICTEVFDSKANGKVHGLQKERRYGRRNIARHVFY